MSAKAKSGAFLAVSSEDVRKKLAASADRKEKLRKAAEEEIILMNDKISAVRAGLQESRREKS
jgi:hypothetical protein